MANDKLTLLKHFELLAMRCAAMVTSKIAELATSVTEALEEMDSAKQDVITGTAGHRVVIGADGKVTTEEDSGGEYISLGAREDIAENADLNDLKTPGCYRATYLLLVETLANLPSKFTRSTFILDVIQINDTGYVKQVFTPINGGCSVSRTWTLSSWTEWDATYSQSNKPTPSELGAAAEEHTHEGFASAEDVNTALTSAAEAETIANSKMSTDFSNVSGTLPVSNGGTGVTTNPSMLVNLGSTSAAGVFAESPRPGVTGTLPVARGGTGATTAAAALTALGAAPAHTYGTTDLTAGSSALASGTLYLVYE